jgi:hypothetical protein
LEDIGVLIGRLRVRRFQSPEVHLAGLDVVNLHHGYLVVNHRPLVYDDISRFNPMKGFAERIENDYQNDQGLYNQQFINGR